MIMFKIFNKLNGSFINDLFTKKELSLVWEPQNWKKPRRKTAPNRLRTFSHLGFQSLNLFASEYSELNDVEYERLELVTKNWAGTNHDPGQEHFIWPTHYMLHDIVEKFIHNSDCTYALYILVLFLCRTLGSWLQLYIVHMTLNKDYLISVNLW